MRVATRARTFAAVSAQDHPRTAAVASTMAGYISTEQYLWGLHRVLNGLHRSGTPSA